MINVRVPATSANLGVGYDCMGIALEEFANVSFEIIEEGVLITGCEEAYCDEENLIYRAFLMGLDYMKESICGVHIHVETAIPFARGLGSSATCIVAGIAGANALCMNRMSTYEIFALATRIEGHPDNIAPAIFGGLCISFMEEDKPNVINYGINSDLLFITMIPDYEVSTKEAREVLPTHMSYTEAVYQMGRCAALAKAIELGNPTILKKACTDHMHEPYRKQLIPEYATVKKICAEAITMYISGSGSTMIALTQDEKQADEIRGQMQKQFPSWSIRILHASYEGMSWNVR